MSVAINSVEAGAAANWIKKGWELFTKAWLKLVIGTILFYVGFFIVSFIPIIGQLFLVVAAPCAMVAANIAMKDIDATGDFNWQTLFDRLKPKFIPTLIVSAVNLALIIGMTVVTIAVIGGGAAASGAMESTAGVIASVGLGVVISFVFGLAIGLANWFSIPLIALTDISGIDALKASFLASFKNILAMIIFGLIMMVLFIASIFTLGLGLLVVIPLSIGANYAATRDLFPIAARD